MPEGKKATKRLPPKATTPEGRENQLRGLANDLIEKKIRDGSASSQLLLYYAKTSSPREVQERRKLESENALLRARIDQLAAASRSEEIAEKALKAMRQYTGQSDEDD